MTVTLRWQTRWFGPDSLPTAGIPATPPRRPPSGNAGAVIDLEPSEFRVLDGVKALGEGLR